MIYDDIVKDDFQHNHNIQKLNMVHSKKNVVKGYYMRLYELYFNFPLAYFFISTYIFSVGKPKFFISWFFFCQIFVEIWHK